MQCHYGILLLALKLICISLINFFLLLFQKSKRIYALKQFFKLIKKNINLIIFKKKIMTNDFLRAFNKYKMDKSTCEYSGRFSSGRVNYIDFFTNLFFFWYLIRT